MNMKPAWATEYISGQPGKKRKKEGREERTKIRQASHVMPLAAPAREPEFCS